jgi:tRNA threonylcarbamoyladenosine biosynthesis protein TsaE
MSSGGSLVRLRTRGAEETIQAGISLGKTLNAGDSVLLYGDLGAGKTTFAKGVAEALGQSRADITSASFVIVAEHPGNPPLYHVDLYRLADEEAVEEAGVFEFLGADGVAVVEWAERLRSTVPGAIRVKLRVVSESEREIIIENGEQ